ncbi:MAG: hypothetical protein AAB593_00710 [Patescibacteria group bacterium]
MNTKNIQCQNCDKNFTIIEDDQNFYTKMQVPLPTFCPDCRLRRRLAFRNERALYKRNCDLCKKSIVSVYNKDKELLVYCSPCWWSDNWDDTKYGKDYNWNKPFFEQLRDLIKVVPKIALNVDSPKRLINSEYVNYAGPMKNCFMVISAEKNENCMYSLYIHYSNNSADCTGVSRLENSYELFNCQNCYETYYSTDCNNCMGVYFSKDLNNCEYCFGCVSLRNKKYYIFNKPYSKEEYFKELEKFNLVSFKSRQEIIKKVKAFWKKFPNKYYHGKKNNNISGDYVYNSKNVFNSFNVTDGENSKYCNLISLKSFKDCYDYTDWGNNATLVYEAENCGENINNIKFSYGSYVGYNINYCDVVYNSNNMFGCISLKNKQYCILNKQYTKEEYEELVPKIIKHMG